MLKEINKLLGKMSMVSRFSDTKLINEESVLEHTAYVALFSLFVAEKMNQECKEGINIEVLMMKALLHDVEESKTGDIINPTKYSSFFLKKAIDEYGLKCMKDILLELGVHFSLMPRWVESKKGKEGFIVSLADSMAVIYKVEQEVIKFGNRNMLDSIEKGLEEKLFELRVDSKVVFRNNSLILSIIDEGVGICHEINEYT